MNNFFNLFRTKTKEVCAYLHDLQNPADNSLDNDKSIAPDQTESDKSEEKADQADQAQSGTVGEASAFMTEPEKAKFDKSQDEAKTEQPDHAKGTPEP